MVLTTLSSAAKAADCAPCAQLFAQKSQLEQAEQASNNLLQQNRAALAALAPGDISKKVKISSNIVILATRSEQAANSRSLVENDFKAKGCDQCPH